MALNHEQIQQRINNIKKYTCYDSKFYGKLVNWYSDFAWHYGIGLSDDYICDLGQNLDTFDKGDRKIELVAIRQFSPNKTIQRLIHALSCFKDWDYGLLGWNCEHYSRLVATNEAVSYQVKDSLLAFLNHGGYHPTAVKDLTMYLEKLGLSELTSFEDNDNEKIQTINSISEPQLRDSYIKQILLDQFIFISQGSRQQIQNIAKHSHYMAELVNYYYNDHGATPEEAREISRQFQLLAVKITHVQSLYELKIIYQIITLFSDQISRFKHRERKYSWQREIRKNMLEPLGDVISKQDNFKDN